MTDTEHIAVSRLTGALLLISLTSMIAGALIVVPAGLTLNPDDASATLAAVEAQVVLHLVELGLDVSGWLALTAAALAMAAHAATAGRHLALLPTGLLAFAGLAGVLHDAGNLAVTQLAADPGAASAAEAVLLTAKWAVNLAGLFWVSATATAALWIPLPGGLRRAGALAALSGLAAVVLPWTTGLDGPTAAMEQLGYALHLPVMAWWGVLGVRHLRARPTGRASPLH
jgi:hypothetical protein